MRLALALLFPLWGGGLAWGAACPLAEAAAAGDAARVAELLARGSRVDCKLDGRAPVDAALAAWKSQKSGPYRQIAAQLLARGAKARDAAAYFDHAMLTQSEELADLLLPNPETAARWAFRLAYMRGNAAERPAVTLRLLDLMLRKGARVNRRDPRTGDSLLHVAVRLRDAELARFLMSKGADPAARHPRTKLSPTQLAEQGLKGKNAKDYQAILAVLTAPARGP